MLERLNTWLFNSHLDDDEQVVMVLHKHWFIGLRFIFWPSVSFVVLAGLMALMRAYSGLLIVAALEMITVVWWLRNFFDYYLDAWIITTSGILDVEWHGWFHRESSRVLYSDIQGVSYEINGVWQTVLRHGTISVEKVSTGSEISMDHVPSPKNVESVILENMENYLHSKNMKDATVVQDILANVIAREFQIKEMEEASKSES